MTRAVLGIIGGSGVYDLPGLERCASSVSRARGASRRRRCATGEIDGLPVVFLPRHDKGHRLSPSDINYRANIDVLEARRRHRSGLALGLRLVQGGAAARHLRAGRPVRRPHLRPRELVLRQGLRRACLDGASGLAAASPASCRRRARPRASPWCASGTYVCMEGPQFSTLAESLTYKSLGYSVIGMTNMPEAKLAREAEICYATVAMVTDFDCWHPDHDAVTVQDIIKVLTANADKAGRTCGAARPRFPARARAMPDRLRPRARHRDHHRARGARSRSCSRSSTPSPGACCGARRLRGRALPAAFRCYSADAVRLRQTRLHGDPG